MKTKSSNRNAVQARAIPAFPLVSLALPALALLAALAGCRGNPPEDPEVRHDAHGAPAGEETIVRLESHKVFHAGIRIDSVRRKSLPVPLTLPGRVTYNEKTRAHVTARVSGRVDTVRAWVNDRVGAGEPLLVLYSQEYQAMQFELLQAARRMDRPRESADDDGSARTIYESARRKLAVAGASEEDIAALERAGVPELYFRIRAPFSGTILASDVRVGSFVRTGDDLLDIADLSTLWVLADAYEKDLSLVREGMPATISITAHPGRFTGRIASVYSILDEKTRTVKLRVEVANRNGLLKPEMFCSVDVQTAVGSETIKIPESAVLGETERHFVFIALNDTTFEKRDIRTGFETPEIVEVLDGLLEGERIVVKGGFFLKSELAKETFGEEH